MEELKKAILENQNLSENKCGTSIVYLMQKLNISLEDIKIMLNELYSQKFIIIRQGINDKLIFLKN
jgi:hypothetical protein